ncbi:hypothetical protein DSO57_1028328 [Entomophthora muscae]|uniref:Uncharacterized protein n=1 Tax=Entomophthora muscae TaxID=34485 RepID=A0ACC2SQG5_9FUNG|nr:hypothetical protein DSO57_1028328 [Entomophthora muscae]
MQKEKQIMYQCWFLILLITPIHCQVSGDYGGLFNYFDDPDHEKIDWAAASTEGDDDEQIAFEIPTPIHDPLPKA